MQQMFAVATAIGQTAGGPGSTGGGAPGPGDFGPWPQLPEELRGQPAAQAILSDALRQSLEARDPQRSAVAVLRACFCGRGLWGIAAAARGLLCVLNTCCWRLLIRCVAHVCVFPAGEGGAPRAWGDRPQHRPGDPRKARGARKNPPWIASDERES